MKPERKIQPTILLILDGFGLGKNTPTNAIACSESPTLHRLLKNSASLETCGEAVGLPPNVMGNSEVGHMNIGSGRVIWQDLSRINQSIQSGEFQKNPAILEIIQSAKKKKARLHFIGLLSKAGVHSHQEHLHELLVLCKKEEIEKVSIHAFLDGRDTSPRSCLKNLDELESFCKKLGIGEIATLSGRFYAMDRDKRWDRTQKCYEALWGNAPTYTSYKRAIEHSYQQEKGDEFVAPLILKKEACLSEGDLVFCYNYRSDRMRQTVSALALESFNYFDRKHKTISLASMTAYQEKFPFPAAFPTKSIHRILGEVVAEAGLKQLRAAETEKYAHVTFFFNCGKEIPKEGEKWLLVDSPKDVETYDKKPEMSALPLTTKIVQAIKEKKHEFIVINYANADMLGHTGKLAPAIQAVEVLDSCILKLLETAASNNYHTFITADHGNVEEMVDEQGKPHTQHTLNPVPFISIPPSSSPQEGGKNGILADIMPSILTTIGLPIPKEVTGKNIFSKNKEG